ncbi:unnamed protein product [Ixodes persulcatus]
MSLESRPSNSLFKRKEQLKRWEDSETNQESADLPPDKPQKIKFSDGCIFLAACAAGDTAEVSRLLERGADINTTNVDGLTALHQVGTTFQTTPIEIPPRTHAEITPNHPAPNSEKVSPEANFKMLSPFSFSLYRNLANCSTCIKLGNMSDYRSQHRNGDGMRLAEDTWSVCQNSISSIINTSEIANLLFKPLLVLAVVIASPPSNTKASGYFPSLSHTHFLKAGSFGKRRDRLVWSRLAVPRSEAFTACTVVIVGQGILIQPTSLFYQTCGKPENSASNCPKKKKKKKKALRDEISIYSYILRSPGRRPPLNSALDKCTKCFSDTWHANVVRSRGNVRSAMDGWTVLAKLFNQVVKGFSGSSLFNQPRGLADCEQFLSLHLHKQKDQSYGARLTDDLSSNFVASASKASEPLSRCFRKVSSSRPNRAGDSPTPPSVVSRPSFSQSPHLVPDPFGSAFLDEPQRPGRQKIKEGFRRGAEGESAPPHTIEVLPLWSMPGSFFTREFIVRSFLFRTFVMPVRDEESETQRKAHAKRVRETRRSTQGVMLEDLKSAEQQLQKKQQERDEGRQEKPPSSAAAAVATTTATTTTCAPSSATTTTALSEELGRRLSWRNRDKEEEVPAVRVVPSSPDGTPVVTLSMPARARVQRATITGSGDVSHTVTVPIRPRSALDDLSLRDGSDADKDDSRTNSAVQRRRRPKRRSTGVVYLEGEGSQETSPEKESADQDKLRIGAHDLSNDVKSMPDPVRARSGSAGSLADSTKSETESRLSSSAASLQDDDELDYKKLYLELKEVHERLKGKVSRLEDELDSTKRQLEKSQLNNRNSLSDAEKRERRALERKISELEEELKGDQGRTETSRLREENARLREENGALIRVISKLSK